MTTESKKQVERSPAGNVALRRAALAWFIVAAAGQIAFVVMILVHYGTNTVSGNIPAWNNKPLIKGYVPGDTIGNTIFGVHVLLAAVMTLGGLAQLLPTIRDRAPQFHRWNGRLFFILAVVMATGGLWLTWVRRTWLSPVSAVAVSIDGVLILVFAAIAWRLAIRRRFVAHRRWAIRAFMVVNGVWFLRVGIMAWMLTAGRLGMNKTMSGPADVMLEFGSYLIPLAALEAYFLAQRSHRTATKRLAAGAIVVLTGITAIGVFGTVAFMWWPYVW